MAGHIKPPRLLRWRGEWCLFYTDRFSGKHVRRKCTQLGAYSEDDRIDLLRKFRARDKEDLGLALRIGTPDFQRPLSSELDGYLKDVAAREKAGGISKAAAYNLRRCVEVFSAWLKAQGLEHLTTGGLDGAILASYGNHLQGSGRAQGTVNLYKDRLRTALRWLDLKRPKLFPDSIIFWPALKLRKVQAREGVAYSPGQLETFYAALRADEAPKTDRAVKRARRGKRQRFSQVFASQSPTPASRLFLLLALTGMRLGEALTLKWSDVDLQRGRITVYATKTRQRRILPLKGAPEGQIAPLFVKTLLTWQREDPARLSANTQPALALHLHGCAGRALLGVARSGRSGERTERSSR